MSMNAQHDYGPAPDGVSICICTYRRPSVITAIDSIAAQSANGAPRPPIIVIDNDVIPSAKAAIDDYCEKNSLDLTYIHAPAQNISVARNAALDAVTTRWIAFFDDDERAAPGWLASLYGARQGANVVFGSCVAIFPDHTPAWIRMADYHSNPVPDARRPINTGYTSNVLIDLDFLRRHRLRFDLTLGRSGGEDSILFHAMFRAGGILRYAPAAVVYEDVVPSRISLAWIATHRFRVGQTYAMMFRRFDPASYRRICWSAPLKIGACAAMFALTAVRPTRAMWWLMRGIFHSGILSFGLGATVYQEYAPAVEDRTGC
jgi:succinoglycan biosynthesis protein ExoM